MAKLKKYDLISAVLVGLMILIAVISLPNNIYAQTLETIGNQRNVFEAPQIKLNHSVYGVAINTDTNKIYLSTAKSVTVIDGKSGNVTDIHAGAFPTSFRVVYVPTFIAVNPNTNTIYVAHYGLNYIRVIDGYTNTNVTDIRVPYTPTSIAVNPNTNTIYVANSGSNYVTGIVGNNDTDLTNISAGKFPTSIAVNPNTNTIYVANSGSDSVSVINGTNDTNLTDIHLAYTPTSIAVNPNTNTIYVANSGSDFVSVINGNNNKVIGDIHVGAFPTLAVNPNAYTMYPTLAVNPNANTIYVAHYGFDRVTVIDASINKVAAGVTFDINPINSGHIVCDKIESPTNQYLYVGFGITCAAQPNKGFEFSSWNENLGHNSTRSIMTSNSTGSPLKAFLDILGIKTDDPAATFNVTQFGSFTANFKALPPPVPPEFWVPLFTIIASTIVGWSIPSIIGGIKSKFQGRRVNNYYKDIDLLKHSKLLDRDIDDLEGRIRRAYEKGKISEQAYMNLKNKISIIYEQIYKNKLGLLNGNGIQFKKIKNEITDAYAEGKITEQHYKLLQEKISNYNDKGQ